MNKWTNVSCRNYINNFDKSSQIRIIQKSKKIPKHRIPDMLVVMHARVFGCCVLKPWLCDRPSKFKPDAFLTSERIPLAGHPHHSTASAPSKVDQV